MTRLKCWIGSDHEPRPGCAGCVYSALNCSETHLCRDRHAAFYGDDPTEVIDWQAPEPPPKLTHAEVVARRIEANRERRMELHAAIRDHYRRLRAAGVLRADAVKSIMAAHGASKSAVYEITRRIE